MQTSLRPLRVQGFILKLQMTFIAMLFHCWWSYTLLTTTFCLLMGVTSVIIQPYLKSTLHHERIGALREMKLLAL